MSSDIKLDAQDDGWVTIETNVLKSNSSDFILDNSARRQSAGGFRRALVHDETDGLTVNFAGDYPSGVTIQGGARVEGGLTGVGPLRLRQVASAGNALPRTGKIGDLIVVQNDTIDPSALLSDISLWICIGKTIGLPEGNDAVWWQRISVGEPVAGTRD